MKTLKLLSFLTFFISLASYSIAQELKTETIRVAGNCGMCKTRIEKAAKSAGAESADWSAETKMLKLTFNSLSTDAAKIQQAIAAVGHDTRDVKATDEAYNKLPACCKYDREKPDDVTSAQPGMQMNNDKAEQHCGMDCCKEGKNNMHKEAHTGHDTDHGGMMNCMMMQKSKKVS